MPNLDATARNIEPAFAAWAAQLRAVRAEHGRPIIDPSDPRLGSMDDRERAQLTPAELGDLYFEEHTQSLWPAFPLSAPAWSVEREIRIGDWPAVEIWDYSDWVAFESGRVRLERYAAVDVDGPNQGEVRGVDENVVLEINEHRVDIPSPVVPEIISALMAIGGSR